MVVSLGAPQSAPLWCTKEGLGHCDFLGMESYVKCCVCFRSLAFTAAAEASGGGGGGGSDCRRFESWKRIK